MRPLVLVLLFASTVHAAQKAEKTLSPYFLVEGGDLAEAQAHAPYGRAIHRWWDVVAGVRQDFRPGPARTWAAVGVQGLAPYWFEVEATAYIGESGRTHFRFETEYELLLTNRLVLQPLVELEIYGKSDPERGIGAGEVGERDRGGVLCGAEDLLDVARAHRHQQVAVGLREEAHQELEAAGGRVLGVTAQGKDLREAQANAYVAVKKIAFKAAHYRTDIGSKALSATPGA